jgi:hypothetical protein
MSDAMLEIRSKYKKHSGLIFSIHERDQEKEKRIFYFEKFLLVKIYMIWEYKREQLVR